MRKRRVQPKRPDSPACQAPGCPLRYDVVLNNGQAFCKWHHGVEMPERVSEITRLAHVCKPILLQIKFLYQLNASQMISDEPVRVVDGLPDDCRQQDGEDYSQWAARLKRAVNARMTSAGGDRAA